MLIFTIISWSIALFGPVEWRQAAYVAALISTSLDVLSILAMVGMAVWAIVKK